MTTDARVPIGDTGWFQASEEETAEFRAALKVYIANEEALEAMRPDLLCEHPNETVLVTDAGATVRFFPDWEALVATVPWEERQDGAVDFLEDPPSILIV